MADQFQIFPYQVRSAGTDVPPEEIQRAINQLAQQTTVALNTLNTGESSNVNITGGTITGVTGATQSRIDNSLLLATDQFVNQQIASATANVPIPLTGGIYNQASRGTGTTFVIFASGGVIGSVLSIVGGGTGYAVGDLLLVIGGNYDALVRVTNVVGGVIQSGGLQVLYGGTGYSTGATTAGVPVPPGQRSITLTGVLTSNVAFIIQNGTFLTAARRIQANNNTTGAFNVTVFLSNGIGGTTGTGVVLPQGTNNSTAVILQTDGMNDVWLSDTPLGIGALPTAGGTVTGVLNVTNGTASSGSTTGALVVTGGVGVGNNLFAAGSVVAGGGLTGTLGAGTPNTVAATTITATGTITPSQTAGIVGTTTNNNANAGSVGEFVSNTTNNTSLTSVVVANSTSVSLTAGDWDVECSSQFTINAGTTLTLMATGVSTTSATLGSFSQTQVIGGITAGSSLGALMLASPVVRVSLAVTTTVFAVVNTVFSGGTLTCNGFIRARRVR